MSPTLPSRHRPARSGSQPAVPVLVGDGEYPGALAAVRALRAGGYAPWGIVVRPGSFVARSRAAAGLAPAPDARADPDGFAAAISEVGREIGASAVLLGADHSLQVLAERREHLPPALAAGIPAVETLTRATDKNQLSELAGRVGLESPPTATLDAGEPSPFSYPVVVKARQSAVATGTGTLRRINTQRAHNDSQLHALLEDLPGRRGLVQPAIEGPLVTVNGLAWQGRLVCAVHQLSDRVWPPGCGVLAHAVTVAPDRALERGVAQLLGEIGWSGLFNAQFVAGGACRYLIDFNPRVYHSLALAVAAGVNLPSMWMGALRSGVAEPAAPGDGQPGYRVGLHFRSEEDDLPALVDWWRSGRRWAALRGLIPHFRTVHAAFSVRDPYPARTALGHIRDRLLRRRMPS